MVEKCVWYVTPLHSSFYQLFTEYGRLAMEEIYQKPFQVTIYIKWILSIWTCRKWAQDNLWRETKLGWSQPVFLQDWFFLPCHHISWQKHNGKTLKRVTFWASIALCLSYKAWREWVSSDVQMLRKKASRCLLTRYSEMWLVFAGGTWFWVKVMWPLRNSTEEGCVAFHLLKVLLASAWKVSKLLAPPDCC